MHNACVERIFRYNYDNGNIKSSFVSAEGLYPRPVEVFRECFTSEANIETLNDIMYEANTMKVDIDMEEVRLVLNRDYIAMKADAEKEILYRCKMSAGSAIWNAKKFYVPVPGFTVWRTGLLGAHKDIRAGYDVNTTDAAFMSLPITVDEDLDAAASAAGDNADGSGLEYQEEGESLDDNRLRTDSVASSITDAGNWQNLNNITNVTVSHIDTGHTGAGETSGTTGNVGQGVGAGGRGGDDDASVQSLGTSLNSLNSPSKRDMEVHLDPYNLPAEDENGLNSGRRSITSNSDVSEADGLAGALQCVC